MSIEKPGIFKLTFIFSELVWFLILTTVLRSTFNIGKGWWRYRKWAGEAHVVRQSIAFKVTTVLKEISPESYRAVSAWTLG
jgi:hypothetical protein